MKYIRKGQEPERFTAWKAMKNEDWQPNWDALRSPEKPAVHQALLQEQGSICCYCGIRISKRTSHIEHFKPRKIYSNLELNYSNLLASCPGEGDISEGIRLKKLPLSQKHCGYKKEDWYDDNLMVSPLLENCADFFRYTGAGEILPTDEPGMEKAAKETIERLGLNNPKLQAARKKQIQTLLPLIENVTDTELQQLIQGYEQRDSKGNYTPFCFAIAYTLKKYYISG